MTTSKRKKWNTSRRPVLIQRVGAAKPQEADANKIMTSCACPADAQRLLCLAAHR
ncbi:MAG: hypothetical protein ACWGMZ_07190 [Thermoguttaceae bacterium]